MRFLAACFFLLAAGPAAAEPYPDLVARARTAFERQDYDAAVQALDAAQQQRPYSLFLTQNRIAARAMAGDVDGAMQLAGILATRGLFIDLTGEAFARLREHPDFPALAASLAANRVPRGKPVLDLEFTEAGLLPEALARLQDDWLVGSVRTGAILRAGEALAPIAALAGGVYDIEVRGDRLFAAVNDHPPFERPARGDPTASVVEVDVATGLARRTIRLDGEALIGDLEVAPDGRVFATDSITPRIVVLEPGAQVLRTLSRDPRFVNLQGMALDNQRDRLFVADYLVGLFRVDPLTGETHAMANPGNAHLGGIDGLYLYQGDLIGIQNGVTPQRIVRIRLDAAGTTAIRIEVLQQGLADWSEPTHGAVRDDRFVYLATSNWPAYGDDGALRPGAELAPLRIMSIALE